MSRRGGHDRSPLVMFVTSEHIYFACNKSDAGASSFRGSSFWIVGLGKLLPFFVSDVESPDSILVPTSMRFIGEASEDIHHPR